VENLEALVLDSLVTESGDVFTDEFKITLINMNGVSKVILLYGFLGVADKLSDGLDARRTLMVLQFDVLIEYFDEAVGATDSHNFENADHYHFKSFQIPVLVDDGVDDVGSENLLSFASKKEAEVVHHVNGSVVVAIGHKVVG